MSSLSLLAGYASSSDDESEDKEISDKRCSEEDDDDEEEDEDSEAEATNVKTTVAPSSGKGAPKKSGVKLPSASDLFSSVSAGSSFLVNSQAKAPVEVKLISAQKSETSVTGKRGTSGDDGGLPPAKKSNIMVPPQMRRPNVPTEDISSWSTASQIKRHKDAAGGLGEGKNEKGAKRVSKTFRQKEKEKRDRGQASRGKSYVEEEKRLLREAGGGF